MSNFRPGCLKAAPSERNENSRPAVGHRLIAISPRLCSPILDLQEMSVLAPVLAKTIGMTNSQYAFVAQGFLVSYTVAFLLGGLVIDKLGVRWGLGAKAGTNLFGRAWFSSSYGFQRRRSSPGYGGVFWKDSFAPDRRRDARDERKGPDRTITSEAAWNESSLHVGLYGQFYCWSWSS